jgi:DNA-binding NarL/FixJ family response regulator
MFVRWDRGNRSTVVCRASLSGVSIASNVDVDTGGSGGRRDDGCWSPWSRPGRELPVDVLVVDPDASGRAATVDLLVESGQVTLMSALSTLAEALEFARRHRPEVAVVDPRIADGAPVHLLSELCVWTRVLVLAGDTDSGAVAVALSAGATGYLICGEFAAEELISAVVAAAEGWSHLSPSAVRAVAGFFRMDSRPIPTQRSRTSNGLSYREVQVMEHIVRGLDNAKIAGLLCISEKTVKNHISHIYAKLRTTTRAESIARWLGLDNPA